MGFTLIELLIVVAIIAILAAIAVPNFLEAQVRAKVARVKNDLRTMVTAAESYRTDSNNYPLHMLVSQTTNGQADPWTGTEPAPAYNEFHFSIKRSITTPVSYLNTIPLDPFFKYGAPVNPPDVQPGAPAALGQRPARKQLMYSNSNHVGGTPNDIRAAQMVYGAYRLWSGGPDGYRRDVYLRLSGGGGPPANPKDSMRIYDASNGTLSVGDIWRTQKNTDGGRPHIKDYVE
jgi:prepilin-type N-terminal cleavage/methylation domain-containing protein